MSERRCLASAVAISLLLALLPMLSAHADGSPALPTRPLNTAKSPTFFRDTPQPTIDLPGVMRIEGVDPAALDHTKTRVVTMRQSVEPVFISNTDPNTIILPFSNPGKEHYSNVDVRTSKSNLAFVYTTGNEPSAVFFYPQDSSTVFGLQLIPRNIPAQVIVVKNEERTALFAATVEGNTYNAKLQRLFETVASGATPPGFARYEIDLGPILLDKGALIEKVDRFSSREMEIHAYLVKNPTAMPIVLSKKTFDGPTVIGVSIFAGDQIESGKSATVIVISTRGEGTNVSK